MTLKKWPRQEASISKKKAARRINMQHSTRYETRAVPICPYAHLQTINGEAHRPKGRSKAPTIFWCENQSINQSNLVRQNIVKVGDPLVKKLLKTCWSLVFSLIWLRLFMLGHPLLRQTYLKLWGSESLTKLQEIAFK